MNSPQRGLFKGLNQGLRKTVIYGNALRNVSVSGFGADRIGRPSTKPVKVGLMYFLTDSREVPGCLTNLENNFIHSLNALVRYTDKETIGLEGEGDQLPIGITKHHDRNQYHITRSYLN